MRILVTNDDGINDEGLRLLARWAQGLGEVTVVAPSVGQSAKSHAIELEKPYKIRKVPFLDGYAYAVDSTPADCVRFGIVGLQKAYDLVLSGINRGVNVGSDIVYSGTVGAVLEGIKQGVKGIAFSAYPDGQKEGAALLDTAYAYLVENGLFDDCDVFNINLPKRAEGVRMTYQGSDYYDDRFVKVEGEEDTYKQVGKLVPDKFPTDLDRDTVALLAGYITVTPLLATRTDMSVFRKHKR